MKLTPASASFGHAAGARRLTTRTGRRLVASETGSEATGFTTVGRAPSCLAQEPVHRGAEPLGLLDI